MVKPYLITALLLLTSPGVLAEDAGVSLLSAVSSAASSASTPEHVSSNNAVIR